MPPTSWSTARLDGAATYLALAERRASEVPAERRHRFDVALGVARMSLARRRGDSARSLEEVQPLLDPSTAETADEVVLGNDARAVALMNLGIVELWSFRFDDAERHLEQGLELARRIGPALRRGRLSRLSGSGRRAAFLGRARERCLEAIAIAEAHGWEAEPIACIALATMASADVAQGRFEEAQHWLDRAERALRPESRARRRRCSCTSRGACSCMPARASSTQALGALRAAERLPGDARDTAPPDAS